MSNREGDLVLSWSWSFEFEFIVDVGKGDGEGGFPLTAPQEISIAFMSAD